MSLFNPPNFDPPILQACADNDIKKVEQLLQKDPNCHSVTNVHGLTPAYIAKHHKHNDVLKTLVSYGAQVPWLVNETPHTVFGADGIKHETNSLPMPKPKADDHIQTSTMDPIPKKEPPPGAPDANVITPEMLGQILDMLLITNKSKFEKNQLIQSFFRFSHLN